MNMPEQPLNPNGKKIGVFVIAYNAEAHIRETLDRIPDDVWNGVTEIYVIDDCSTDETVGKALSYERPGCEKLTVIRNRTNRRYGGNQKFGYQYAIDRGFDLVVMLHADGQYAPEMLACMVRPIVEEKADVVIGSRMREKANALKGGMPRYKYWGNIVLTKIQNALAGTSLSEYHSGYRAYAVSLLKRIPLWENTDEWHFDSQILMQAHLLKSRMVEISIPTYYGSEICHVNGVAYGLQCIFTALKFYLFRRGIMYSRLFDVTKALTRYSEKFDDPYSSHSMIWRYFTRESLTHVKILELGVGDAGLTRRLSESGAVVDTLDIDQRALDIAKPYSRRAMIYDLDRIEEWRNEERYDIIIAADVLEHLVNPALALSVLKRLLKKNGRLIVSLPNVANIYVRINMLIGRFPYHWKGILDDSHLRFYTLSSARRLLTKTGWRVEKRVITPIPVAIVFPFLRTRAFRWILHAFYYFSRCWPGLFAYQGVFLCRNPNESALL